MPLLNASRPFTRPRATQPHNVDPLPPEDRNTIQLFIVELIAVFDSVCLIKLYRCTQLAPCSSQAVRNLKMVRPRFEKFKKKDKTAPQTSLAGAANQPTASRPPEAHRLAPEFLLP